MVRAVFAGVLAAALFAGPVMALAQTTDMVTYGDTMRKKSAGHSAVRPVTRGSVASKKVSSRKASGVKHTASAKHAASAKSGAQHAHAKAKHHK